VRIVGFIAGLARSKAFHPAHVAGSSFQERDMRSIDSHRVNPANDSLMIGVMDAPGAGGANHLYMVEGFDTSTNPSDPFTARHGQPARHATILFQNGPIAEFGVNGITQEVLIAILIDRLQAFQAGPFANDYNAAALAHLQSAQGALFDRTRNRMTRGVEGTHAA
jgi:hypothetical protein